MLDLILVITESSMQILSEEQGDMSVTLKRKVHIFWLWIAKIKQTFTLFLVVLGIHPLVWMCFWMMEAQS